MFVINDVHKKSLGNNERASTKATNFGSTTVEPKTKLLSKIFFKSFENFQNLTTHPC